MEFKEYKGKNVDEAITNACIDLGIEAAKLANAHGVIRRLSDGCWPVVSSTPLAV